MERDRVPIGSRANIIRIGSRRKSNLTDDLKIHIEEILGEESGLEVNEIKERLVEKDTSLPIQLYAGI